MAKFYIPNPASALPKPRVIAPKQPSLIAAGLSAFNTGLGEVADAFRARERNRKELNAAADLVEADDPNQAQVYRQMASELDAYVPLAGNPEQARAASRVSGSVSSGILSDIIQTQNRMRLEKLEQQNALERIGVEFGNRLQYLEAATAADRDLKEFGMGLEKEIIKFREGAQNESEVRNMAFDFGPRAVDSGADPEKVGNILNSMRDGAITPDQAYSQMLAEVPSIQARANLEAQARGDAITNTAQVMADAGVVSAYGITREGKNVPGREYLTQPQQRALDNWYDAYKNLDEATASLDAARAAAANSTDPNIQALVGASVAKYNAAQQRVTQAEAILKAAGMDSPFGSLAPNINNAAPSGALFGSPDSPDPNSTPKGRSLDRSLSKLRQ